MQGQGALTQGRGARRGRGDGNMKKREPSESPTRSWGEGGGGFGGMKKTEPPPTRI